LTDQQPSFLNGFQRLLEVGLIVMGAISIYILITLFSYDPADPSWTKTGNYEFIKNAGGAFGAWLSDILLFTFGWLAFFVPVILSVIGWLFFRKFHDLVEVDYLALGLRLIGFVLFIVGFSAICSMNFDDVYYYSSGGIIGDVISFLLSPLLGFTGATLLFLVAVMVGFTLMTGISWLQVIDGIGKYSWLGGEKALALAKSMLGLSEPKAVSMQTTTLATGSTTNPLTHSRTNIDSPELQSKVSTNSDNNQIDDATKADPLDKKRDDSLLANFFSAADSANEQSEEHQTTEEKNSRAESTSQQSEAVPESTLSSTSKSIPNMLKKVFDKSSKPGPTPTDNIDDKRKDVSFDDDMPFEFGDEPMSASKADDDIESSDIEGIDTPMSYSSIDDDLSDDDILGALEGMQTYNDTPVRDTNASQQTAGVIVPPPQEEKPPITLPSLELLDRPDKVENPVSQEELEAVSRLVEAKLLDFNIQAEVVGVYPGPVITRFELDLAPGIKVSKISGLSKDLARSLSAMSVRVVEVIPGKSYIGLEIPNKHRQIVRLSEVMSSDVFDKASSPLTMVLGKDIGGKAVVVDLAKMPHLLVAGTTGSGKSVGVNTMILSLLYKSTPEEVRLIMIDPKMLELSVYEGIPHLLSEVVTDMKEAANALRWCVGEMERRYKLMSSLGVRNLKGYNAKIDQARQDGKPIRDPLWRSTDNMLEMPPELDRLPAIVVVIDEFADMMMIVGKKVEELIARIAQKARAAGIHLVLATQRPSVDVITGLIKANIPTRMAFQVSSKIDSRTILDQQGAENLLGMGDMLYLPPGSGVPTRVHGAFVDDHEVHAVVNDWKSKAKPNYIKEILEGEMTDENMLPGEAAEMAEGEEADPVFDEAVAFVTETRKVSISSIQRKLRIGYNRSARIVEQMESMGIVSRAANNGTREVLAPPPVKGEDQQELL